MAAYIGRRVLHAIVLIFLVSIISFVVIQLPPGDYASIYVARISQTTGMPKEQQEQLIAGLRKRYALDRPMLVQYARWISNILTEGDFGISFTHNRPVSRILAERIPLTVMVGFITLVFQFLVAIPIGIVSALKKHTVVDYVFTFVSFLGRSIPEFLAALILMVLLFNFFHFSIGGLFSPQYESAPWSLAKLLDLLKHLVVPVIVIGMASTADTVRILRATMLDELQKEYVGVARSKGLSEWRVILKYPVRLALNPIIAALGWQLPVVISGALIVSIVVNLPTTGPLIYLSLLAQDMYLAGAFVLALSTVTIFGTLISDILLVISDPRISFQ